MSDFISPILQWINQHPELAGLATFIISAAESVAIIGTIIPGTVIMTAIGTLAGAGVMPLWSTILWAILGAVVGDGISYWIGYYFKDRLRDVWPFRNYPNLLESGIRFFKKHGGKSVFIGRFVGPVRALVPLVAGMLRMKPLRFTISNIASAIGWAPAYMLPGIALGAASLELPADIAVHAILMLLLVGLFIILCLWILQKSLLLINQQINQSLTHGWQSLESSRHFSVITRTLKHYDPNKTFGQLTLAFYFIVTCVFFIYLACFIHAHGSQDIFINNFFFHLFRSVRSTSGDTIMVAITLLGESKVILPLFAVLFIYFGIAKRWRTAWHVLALGILTAVSVEIFKHLIHSQRPWGIVLSPPSGSFPSGHATFATVFFFGIALLLNKAYQEKFRCFFYIPAIVIITAVSISRLYVGAHWFTDVIGGLLLGTAILMLIVISYNRQQEKPLNPIKIIVITFITLFLSYSVYFYYGYNTLKQNSRPIDWPEYSLTLPSWWKQTNKQEQEEQLPTYRVNRFGFSTQILNLQWLEDFARIKQTLLKNGWQIPPERDWITVLHRLSDVQSAEHLPLLSPLYLNKNPDLILIKHDNSSNKLIVLRLWKSNAVINTSQHAPLWVGTVEAVPRTYSWLFKHKWSNDIDLTPTLIFLNIPSRYDIKKITINNYYRHNIQQTILLIKPKNIK